MSKAAFFRQSGWMMAATVMAGALMWGVHFLSKEITEAEYGTLVTLLTATILIPSIPLQMVFAQQTAAALARGERRQLAGKIRLAWIGTFLLWLAGALLVLSAQDWILKRWSIANPAALWATLFVALGCLWTPLFFGLLQGSQNFLWLGTTMILSGVGRLGLAALLVLAFGGQSASILTGAGVGYALVVVAGMWQTRALWSGPSEPFDWRGLLRQIVPLMLGFGATQFLFSADTVFVKTWFPDETAYYGAAGTLSRALIWLVGPLVAVMFPKIVHSTAKAEQSDLMPLTLGLTAVLALGAVLGLWVLGPFVVRLVFRPDYVTPTTAILPWYAGAMVPLSLANVLVNSLLARLEFRVVPWLLALALAYAVALTRFHASVVQVLQTLAVFCALALALSAWFTWRKRVPSPRPKAQSPTPSAPS